MCVSDFQVKVFFIVVLKEEGGQQTIIVQCMQTGRAPSPDRQDRPSPERQAWSG